MTGKEGKRLRERCVATCYKPNQGSGKVGTFNPPRPQHNCVLITSLDTNDEDIISVVGCAHVCTDSFSPPGLQVMCARMCVFYSAMCLAGWPLSSEAARLRCGSDLLSDLIFVCGDRGIYLGEPIFIFYTIFT